jgi:hypothetical protein
VVLVSNPASVTLAAGGYRLLVTASDDTTAVADLRAEVIYSDSDEQGAWTREALVYDAESKRWMIDIAGAAQQAEYTVLVRDEAGNTDMFTGKGSFAVPALTDRTTVYLPLIRR